MKKILLSLSALAISAAVSAQTYFTEDWSNGMNGWTFTAAAGSDGWNVGSATALSSQYFPIPALNGDMIATNDDNCNCDKSADFLISPSIDLSAATGPVLTFSSFHFAATYGGGTESATVRVSNDGGTTWTDLNTLPGDGTGWSNEGISLSAYAGDTIMLGFFYDDDGVWSYGWALDDIAIKDLPAVEVVLNELIVPNTLPMGSNGDIAFSIENKGGNTITSLDLVWTDGTNVYTDNVTGLNIPSFGTDTLIHADAFNQSTFGNYQVGGAVVIAGDVDTTNNNGLGAINVLSFATSRKVVIEEGTGTWCGWCPRGTVAMEYMTQTYDNSFVGIAVHNGDPMTVTAYDNGAGITGFPGMNVDRTILGAGVSTGTMQGYYTERMNEYPLADVQITSQSLNTGNGDVTISVEAQFAADVAGDYRFAVVVLEDSITGTSQGYSQANYYSGGGNGNLSGAGFDWHLEADPVPFSKMFYNHVGVKLIGGYSGQSGSVPATVAANGNVTHTFNSNIAADVDDYAQVSFAVLLLDPDGQIVNADKEHASLILSTEEELVSNFEIFPNPTEGIAQLALDLSTATEVNIEVIDQLGRVVLQESNQKLPAGRNLTSIDLSNHPAGIYTVSLNYGGKSIREKLIVQ